jgi:hypothetical protein
MARVTTVAGRALTVNKYRVSWRESGSLFDRLRKMLAGIEEAEHGITECSSDGDVTWRMRQTLREHSSVQRRGRGGSPAPVSTGM